MIFFPHVSNIDLYLCIYFDVFIFQALKMAKHQNKVQKRSPYDS